ncbi:MAG TPA: ferrochelatase, partial [Stellaceae bacterium]|nr:ferrochelatase [Stellaceae bacterium]
APDRAEAVRPFLVNLFSDPQIITFPQPLRWILARLIAAQRARAAREIYAALGNASPLLANTEAQARSLEAALGPGYRVFVAMRHWHPMSERVACEVKEWAAAEIILLPLYPQFSTTTTGSSFRAWAVAAAKIGLKVPTSAVRSYPTASGLIAALAAGIEAVLRKWPPKTALRLLFSAHGLPKRIVAAGDPYPQEVEATAAALRSILPAALDTVVCYQSRVGPLPWLEPATDAEIRRAGAEGVGVIVVPISFVSEHSETLIELDRDYRHIAGAAGVPIYIRVPALGTDPRFIDALATLVRTHPHPPPLRGGSTLSRFAGEGAERSSAGEGSHRGEAGP